MLSAHAHVTAAQDLGVSGSVRYFSNESAVPNVSVLFTGMTQSTATTDATGLYNFSDPGLGSATIQPSKFGQFNGALSAVDASWVLQFVVGLRQFDGHQLLTCDVTGDGTVSSLDAARILQLVAGVRSRFPVAESCGSDWVFVPDPATIPNQHLLLPQTSPQCSAGAIVFDTMSPPVSEQDFVALLFGDCTGNWAMPVPTATATATVPAVDTATSTPEPSLTPTATPIIEPTATITVPVPATATHTGTPTRSATPTTTATNSSTASGTATATRTATFTRTGTPTWTQPPPPTATRTRTATGTVTHTRTATGTRTHTPTRSNTPTLTPSITRTHTRTQTPSLTPTMSPTPTATCAAGLQWSISPPQVISTHPGTTLWLTRTVPTNTGWGVFWLRKDPSTPRDVLLYYAHVDFDGQISVEPRLLRSIDEVPFRGHYYFAAWNGDHYGLLIADGASVRSYSLALNGQLSGGSAIPNLPLLFNTQWDQETDGDLDAYPGGFIGVIEGECGGGHSCAYAFKLTPNGALDGSIINLVDFDFTHQFYPRVAFDGAGFAILSVKDIEISGGGVMTKYWPLGGTISSHAKVVPSKEYLWDEFPDLAHNGDHFAAIWTENSRRSHSAPWQIHFASFRRTKPSSVLIADRVIDMVTQKTNHRWTTQMHAHGADWIAQYASRTANNSIIAVYELLGDDGVTRAALEPFLLSADALGSSPHFDPDHAGVLGIARGSVIGTQSSEVTFHTLPPPSCPH